MAVPKVPTSASRRVSSANSTKVSIWVLVLSNLLILQINFHGNREREVLPVENVERTAVVASSQVANALWTGYPLVPNTGKAVALPSVLVTETESVDRKFYGGQGDKKHLGGFVDIDLDGISPALWKYMITFFGVKSIVDVGCGRGFSTAWFYLHGVEALCLEGSHDAVSKTLLPDPATQIVEHDFSRGPWWPEKTYDAVWSVEFLEHVGRNYHINYFAVFRKAALIFASHSTWGGWHHVEVHNDQWWITKFEMYGFIYSAEWTNATRTVAIHEANKFVAPNGALYNAHHVRHSLLVFINPAVAALPQHSHLIAGPGCFHKRENNRIKNKECDGIKETKLPPQFDPLVLTEQQDKEWEELVKKNIIVKAQ